MAEKTIISSNPTPDSQKYREAQANLINAKRISGANYSQPFFVKPAEGNSQGSYSLEPETSHTFNIVKDFKWTTSSFKKEVPRIELVEYQITQNQQANYITKMMKGISKTTAVKGIGSAIYGAFSYNNDVNTLKDPYEGLYTAKETKFRYIFPFYSPTTVSTKVTWSSKMPPEGKSLVVAAAGGMSGAAIDAMTGSSEARKAIEQYAVNAAAAVENINAPFAGIEQPMWYTGTAKNNYTIKFPLFNTISVEETLRNYDFIRVFNYQNLHLRTTFATYLPPVFYKCEQNGDGEYWNELGAKPAVYVSNFVVQNIGAIRAINIEGSHKMSVPEAYMVEITLSEMITTSRNIYASVFTGDPVKVVSKQ
jgi:hypothetical protein